MGVTFSQVANYDDTVGRDRLRLLMQKLDDMASKETSGNVSRVPFRRPLKWPSTVSFEVVSDALAATTNDRFVIMENEIYSEYRVKRFNEEEEDVITDQSCGTIAAYSVDRFGEGTLCQVSCLHYALLHLRNTPETLRLQEFRSVFANNEVGSSISGISGASADVILEQVCLRASQAPPYHKTSDAENADDVRTMRLLLALQRLNVEISLLFVEHPISSVSLDMVKEEQNALCELSRALDTPLFRSIAIERGASVCFSDDRYVPPWRRVRGDLCYLRVVPFDGSEFMVSCTTVGFYKNKGFRIDYDLGMEVLDFDCDSSLYPSLTVLLRDLSPHFDHAYNTMVKSLNARPETKLSDLVLFVRGEDTLAHSTSGLKQKETLAAEIVEGQDLMVEQALAQDGPVRSTRRQSIISASSHGNDPSPVAAEDDGLRRSARSSPSTSVLPEELRSERSPSSSRYSTTPSKEVIRRSASGEIDSQSPPPSIGGASFVSASLRSLARNRHKSVNEGVSSGSLVAPIPRRTPSLPTSGIEGEEGKEAKSTMSPQGLGPTAAVATSPQVSAAGVASPKVVSELVNEGDAGKGAEKGAGASARGKKSKLVHRSRSPKKVTAKAQRSAGIASNRTPRPASTTKSRPKKKRDATGGPLPKPTETTRVLLGGPELQSARQRRSKGSASRRAAAKAPLAPAELTEDQEKELMALLDEPIEPESTAQERDGGDGTGENGSTTDLASQKQQLVSVAPMKKKVWTQQIAHLPRRPYLYKPAEQLEELDVELRRLKQQAQARRYQKLAAYSGPAAGRARLMLAEHSEAAVTTMPGSDEEDDDDFHAFISSEKKARLPVADPDSDSSDGDIREQSMPGRSAFGGVVPEESPDYNQLHRLVLKFLSSDKLGGRTYAVAELLKLDLGDERLQLGVIELGGVPPLIHTLRSATGSALQACVQVIATLCMNPLFQVAMIKLRGVDSILQLLSESTGLTQAYTAAALSYCSNRDIGGRLIRRRGGLKKILELVSSRKVKEMWKRDAALAAERRAAEGKPAGRDRSISRSSRAGAAQLRIPLGNRSNATPSRHTIEKNTSDRRDGGGGGGSGGGGGGLTRHANASDGPSGAGESGGGTELGEGVVDLTRMPPLLTCVIHATRVITNCCRHDRKSRFLVIREGSGFLKHLMEAQNDRIVCNVQSMIQYCALEEQYFDIVEESGAVKTLVSNLQVFASRPGALSGADATVKPRNSPSMHHLAPPDVEVAQRMVTPSPPAPASVANFTPGNQPVSPGPPPDKSLGATMVDSLVGSINWKNTWCLQAMDDSELLRQCVAGAMGALAHCSQSKVLRRQICEVGGVSVLLTLLGAHDLLLLASTALCVKNITIDTSNVPGVVEANGVLGLVNMLSRDVGLTVLKHTTAALWHCARSPVGRAAVRDAGGLPILVQMLNTTVKWDVLVNVTGALGACAEDDENKRKIAELDGIRLVWSLLKHPNPNVKAVAACAICPCISSAENLLLVRQYITGGLSIMVRLLESENTVVQAAACEAIANIATDEHMLAILTEQGVLPLLAKLTSTAVHEKVRENLALAIGQVCMFGDNCARLGELGGVTPLVAFLDSPRLAVRRNTAVALRELSEFASNSAALHATDVVPKLIDQLGSTDAVLQDSAAAALENIRRYHWCFHITTEVDSLLNKLET